MGETNAPSTVPGTLPWTAERAICPGPMDSMGCMMPETCVAEGDECPFYCPYNPPMGCMGPESCVAIGEECPFHCPPMWPVDCGEGMISCPGGMDPMGRLMPEMCMPEGELCPAMP